MGLFTRDIQSLEDLFKHALKDIYYAEQQILKTLPKLIEKAADPRLKKDLKQHLKETEGQVVRLDQVFAMLGEEPMGTRCPAIDGILNEGDSILGEVEGRSVTGAAIIFAAQAVEHYEITRYGTLIAWASEMGREDIARKLEATLREEKAADRKLTVVAEARLNRKADKTATPRRRSPAGRRAAHRVIKRKPAAKRKSA
jgi:ferritin-like metal-binding protein YciE